MAQCIDYRPPPRSGLLDPQLTSALTPDAKQQTSRPSSMVFAHKGNTVQKFVSRFWRGILSREELAAKLPPEIWEAIEGAASEEEMCRLAKKCTNRAKKALRQGHDEPQRAATGKPDSTKRNSDRGGVVDLGSKTSVLDAGSQDSMKDTPRSQSIGAIVVPSHISEFFCMAVNGVDGWMDKLWHVTEFDPAEFDSGFGVQYISCSTTLHAVHLSRRGSGLLNALCAALPQSVQYELVEMLARDETSPENIEQRLDRLEVNIVDNAMDGKSRNDNGSLGVKSLDRAVLHKLCIHCDDLGSLEKSSFALWVPGLTPACQACCRSWDAPLYEAWHLHKNAQPRPRFTFIELFAGIGGFRIGLEALGGRCVFACEEDLSARSTYMHNFSDVDGPAQPIIDVRCVNTANLPAFDILTAGFPCQPYTQTNTKRQGLTCDNGQLVFEVVRILRECRPAAALLENVPDLLTSRRGVDFQRIVTALEEAGYAVGWQLISAEHFVPQVRVRLYIVCIRRDLCNPELNPGCVMNGQDGDHAGDAVIRWLEPELTRPTRPAERSKLLIKEILECQASNASLDMYTLREEQWAKVVAFEEKKKHGCLEKRFVQLDGQARTLISHYKENLYFSQFVPQPGSRPRFFTPRECARLMGFPDTFKPGVTCFPGSRWLPEVKENSFYRQLGNAVVPAVIQEIGARILDAIKL